MQLDLTGHHIDITPPLREYVTSKMTRIEQHFDQVSRIHCILTVEKLRHKAEATIEVRGAKIYADAIEDDMYAAIDGMTDKINRRIRRHKEKQTDHHARHADKRSL